MARLREQGEAASAASVMPTNSMGGSSSTAGTGGIDSFDPLMSSKKQKLSSIVKRKSLKDISNGKKRVQGYSI